MAKTVKYEVVAKIVKKDQSVELRRIFRKLKNARDFVSETIKGLECTPFTEKEGELVRATRIQLKVHFKLGDTTGIKEEKARAA